MPESGDPRPETKKKQTRRAPWAHHTSATVEDIA
jgi:hypothetical protein